MSRPTMLIVLGAAVALSPFSGLPLKVLSWILPVLGLVALGIGVSMKRERAAAQKPLSHEAPVIPA